jgi:hypothetical protein
VEIDGFVEAYFYIYNDEFDIKINGLIDEGKPFYISSDSINTVANLKRSSKGSFEDKIFLEWVEKPDDN